METIAEVLSSVGYFSLNPLAWSVAIAVAMQTGILRKPVIATVLTQVVMAGLLIALIALSDKPFPVYDVFVLLLIPGALSGLLISAPVLMVTKRRRLMRFVSSRRTTGLAYK